MKRISIFLTGILVGATLFTGTAAYASGIMAERSSQPIFVDGKEVKLEAYGISGSNYIKLRDMGQAVGFNVYWDDANRCVRIESDKPYTGEPAAEPAVSTVSAPQSADNGNKAEQVVPAASEVSGKANANAFVGGYTMQAYLALRQAIENGSKSEVIAVSAETEQAMQKATAAFGQWPVYHVRSASDNSIYFEAAYPKNNQLAADGCESFINSLSEMTTREKVEEIAFFVCDHITYDAASTALPYRALTSESVSKGNCMSYAHNFLFLCDMAKIPCVFVHSNLHQWNQVYVDGEWWDVDVTSTDAGDSYDRRYCQVLHPIGELQGEIFKQTEPELTTFVKELLVPGST